MNPAVLPADLRGDAGSIPQLTETTYAGMVAYKQQLSRQQLLAEDRLAYVVNRAKRLLVGTATPGDPISAMREQPPATCGRSSRRRSVTISCSPRLRRQDRTIPVAEVLHDPGQCRWTPMRRRDVPMPRWTCNGRGSDLLIWVAMTTPKPSTR